MGRFQDARLAHAVSVVLLHRSGLRYTSAATCSYGQAQRLMGVRPQREGALAAEVEFTAKQCGVYSRVHFGVLVRVRDRGLVSAAAGLCVFPGVRWPNRIGAYPRKASASRLSHEQDLARRGGVTPFDSFSLCRP